MSMKRKNIQKILKEFSASENWQKSLECIGEAYGPEVRKQYELMIKENT